VEQFEDMIDDAIKEQLMISNLASVSSMKSKPFNKLN
jgi:hypothetical protein